MQIKNVTLPDEGRVLALLQPYFNNKLNPRRNSEWVTGREVPTDQPVPMVVRQSSGVNRKFLKVGGLPEVNEWPTFNSDVDVHNDKRAILPIAQFQFDYSSRKSGQAYRTVRPGQGREMFFFFFTYDLKPGYIEPDRFYPKLVRTSGGLGHASVWEPLFIDPHETQRWLYPWHDPKFELRGRPFDFFKLGESARVA